MGWLMQFPIFRLLEFEASSGEQRTKMAQELDTICRDTGFLLLDDHGVPEHVIAAQWEVVARFFACPVTEKQKVAAPYAGYPYGWLGPNQEALAASKGEKTPPDLKESFNGGPLSIPENIADTRAYEFCYQPTLWPDIEGFKEAWCRYYQAMEDLAKRVMAALGEALGLARSYFDPFLSQPISALRALHYPATAERAEVGQQRAGAHTDYGSLTILLPQSGRSGLQISHQGEWIDVPAPEGCFVINIGDLMEHWTSGRWVSTLHRVVAQPNQLSRKSLAFFHQPNWEAQITPINDNNGKTVVSGPYLMDKFKSTNL